MTAAADKTTDPRGLKRICMDCGTRFYDMNNRPIVCPSCSTEFTGEVKVKTRRTRAAAVEEAHSQVEEKTAKDDSTEDEDDELAGAEVVSLDDLENAESKGTDDDDEISVNLDADDDDLDEIEVDDDLGGLQDLEPDAEVEVDDEDKQD